jgi:hypothetical protein
MPVKRGGKPSWALALRGETRVCYTDSNTPSLRLQVLRLIVDLVDLNQILLRSNHFSASRESLHRIWLLTPLNSQAEVSQIGFSEVREFATKRRSSGARTPAISRT